MLVCRVINHIKTMTGLQMILLAPLWSHREWFLNLLLLLVVEPLQHPKVWDLLMHISLYPGSYQSSHMELSSNFLENKAFQREL